MKTSQVSPPEKFPDDWMKNEMLSRVVTTNRFIDMNGFTVSIALYHQTTFPLREMSRHSHPHFELSFIRSGNIVYRTDNRRLPREKGGVFFMPPHTPHTWQTVRAPCVIDGFMIEFFATDSSRRDFIERLPALSATNEYTLSFPAAARHVFETIDSEISHGGFYAEKRIGLMIHDLFYQIMRDNFAGRTSAGKRNETLPMNEREKYLFLMAKTHIEQTGNHTVTAIDIARHLDVTERYVNQIFNQYAGVSCGKYLQERKLIEAYQMLRSRQKMKIREIAREVGFADELYFTRTFTKRFGLSPKKVRDMNF